MANRPSVVPADGERRRKGGPSTDQVVLWVQFPVSAGFPQGHTKNLVVGAAWEPWNITDQPGVSIM